MYYKPGHVIDSIEESQYIYLYQRPLNLCMLYEFIYIYTFFLCVCVCQHYNVRTLTIPPVLKLWDTQGHLWLPYDLIVKKGGPPLTPISLNA